MTLKSIAQINVMSSMGSYDAAHLRTTSSPTFTSESSGAAVMPVASDRKTFLHFANDANGENQHFYRLLRPLTCDSEVARTVGLPSAVLSKARVDALVILGGIEDLQAPIKQDGNAK